MQRPTRNSSLKATQAIKENSRVGRSNKKKNFDSENVPPSNGTKRDSSPSGCPPPNPKRKAIGDITNCEEYLQNNSKKDIDQEKEYEKMPKIKIEQSEQMTIEGTQVNTPTIQPLELDGDEHISVEFKNKKGVFSPEYSQSDSDESLEGSPKVKACIAYDHFGIFYCHMASQETCEHCLIAGTNQENLNKHIKKMKIPFKDVRCFTFAFKDKSETLKLKIIDPIPSGWKIIEQNQCGQISKKSIALFEKSKRNPNYPHVPDCRISMDTKPEDTTVHIKLEGIISDKNYHKCVFKNLQDIKSQQSCGSKNTASRSYEYNLRPRSYSASPKSNSSTAESFDGRSSSQDNSSRCKLLVSSLRYNHSDICDVLFKNSTALSYLKLDLYSKEVIDNPIKKIGKTIEDISTLIDIVSAYIKGGEESDGGIKRCEVVMKCFNDQEALRDVVKKINEYRK